MLNRTRKFHTALKLAVVSATLSIAAVNAEAVCGDGAVETGEECDDGNLNNNDGCNELCEIESPAGCSDGTREGFSDRTTYPTIASCAGNWDIPGVRSQSDKECSNHGNSSAQQSNCLASDLCSVGWHICGSSADVVASAPTIISSAQCNVAAADNSGTAYFTSQTSGPGNGNCSNNPADHNDLFGCGSRGLNPQATCGILGRFGNDQCNALSSDWSCPNSFNEQVVITKTGDAGGVMCCFGAGAQVSLSSGTLNGCVARPTIEGTALDSNGNPLNAALVSVSFPSGTTVEVNTAADGSFSVPWPVAEPDIIAGAIATVGAHVHNAVTNWNGATFQISLTDSDGDLICDSGDLCFGDNSTLDADGDGICGDNDLCTGGDASGDTDSDRICDDIDNCVVVANADQADGDNDNIGDACDAVDDLDVDEDTIPNGPDNCPFTPNTDQADADSDGLGDVCDITDGLDADGDGILNDADNCPFDANSDQADADGDGLGDVCDATNGLDADDDGILNDMDNCPFDANTDQADADGDGQGDVCDTTNGLDTDGDGINNDDDPCPLEANSTECLTATFVDDCACSSGKRGSSSGLFFVLIAFVVGFRRRRTRS